MKLQAVIVLALAYMAAALDTFTEETKTFKENKKDPRVLFTRTDTIASGNRFRGGGKKGGFGGKRGGGGRMMNMRMISNMKGAKKMGKGGGMMKMMMKPNVSCVTSVTLRYTLSTCNPDTDVTGSSCVDSLPNVSSAPVRLQDGNGNIVGTPILPNGDTVTVGDGNNCIVSPLTITTMRRPPGGEVSQLLTFPLSCNLGVGDAVGAYEIAGIECAPIQ